MRNPVGVFKVSSAFAPLFLAALIGVVDLYGSSTLAETDSKADSKTNAPATAPKDSNTGAADGSESNSTSSVSTDLTNLPGPSLVTTTSGNLPQAAEQAPARRLRFTLNTRQEFHRGDIDNNESGNRIGFSFVQAGYSLTPTKTIVVRQEFQNTQPKPDDGPVWNTRDIFVGFNNMSLASFWNDATLMSMTRLYLPTGEESRYQTKQQGALLQWFIVNKPLGKFEFDYHLIGLYFNQSQNTYTKPSGKVTANFDYDIETWLSAKYNFTSWFNVFQTAGVDSIWRRPMDGPGVQRMQFMEMETGVSVMPTPNITVIASLFNYANIFDSKNPFGIYRDDETIYRLVLAATM